MKRFVVFVACVAGLTAASIEFSSSQGMPPTLVETDAVTSMEFHDQITLVGRTEALANSQIVAEVAGRVVRIEASEGNPVRRGSVLVSIDPDKIRLALDAKRAQVAQARATAELAEKELARSQDLRQQDLVSEGGLDADLAEHARAQGLYDQYRAEMKQLELDLENCSIRAPFDGYTVRQLVDVGEWVNPGTPVYEIVDLSTVKVFVDLPERYFGQVDKGSTVSIQISGESDATVTGTVTGVAPSASQVTHTFPVIIAVNNKEGRLGGGMLVRTTLSLSRISTSLAVSKDAIVRQGNQTMVYTVTDGKAAPVPVQTGSTEGKMIAITGEGVVEGMPVIVRGNERVFPGSPVRTSDRASGGQSAAGEGQSDDEEPADTSKGNEG
jgi:RND family efflux transporter MFP subunit